MAKAVLPLLQHALGTSDPTDPASPRISVIIPAKNEARNLPHVLPRVPKWVDEIILVDGHSVDDTVAAALRINPQVRIIHQTGRGKGDAIQIGLSAATGDIIVLLDADGSTDPAEIPAFVGALLAGADFVKGSRFLQGGGTADMSRVRMAGNKMFVSLVRVAYGSRVSDLCYGYNAFWRHVLPTLGLDCDGFEVETVMNLRALKARLRVAEVPSFEAPRIYGESNLRTFPDGWRVLRTICKEWFRNTSVPHIVEATVTTLLATETDPLAQLHGPAPVSAPADA